MKHITKEEAQQIKVKPHGRASYARGVLLNMNIGDIIILEKADWNQKRLQPGTYCLQLGRDVKRLWKCETIVDGSGWVIGRVK